MKIFYGVQGTGNGHITRARVMAKEFQKLGFDVTYMFSGRAPDKFFDMEIFGDYIIKTGLTFNINKGKVQLGKTILDAQLKTLRSDIKELDLSGYDIVISDYEPITSWAGKLQKKTVYGIGHQYAFNHKIPKAGNNFITDLVMRNFAPADVGIGLHWDQFGVNILPPIIDHATDSDILTDARTYVVYLPFEDQQEVIKMLSPFKSFNFIIYTPEVVVTYEPHIKFNLPSRSGFTYDVTRSTGVICNAGFELASEALQQGKKLLVKPVNGQMEQISNALAIKQLNYGTTMSFLDAKTLNAWLYGTTRVRVEYPNVAAILAEHIHHHQHLNLADDVYNHVWESVLITRFTL